MEKKAETPNKTGRPVEVGLGRNASSVLDAIDALNARTASKRLGDQDLLAGAAAGVLVLGGATAVGVGECAPAASRGLAAAGGV